MTGGGPGSRHRRGKLSDRATGVLLTIGRLQLDRSSRAVPVGDVIDASSPAQWDSLHVLGRRLLIDTVEPYSVRLTRGGWRVFKARSSRSQ